MRSLRVLVVASTLVLAPAPIAASASRTFAPSVVPNCAGTPTVRPTEVVLACADAGLGVRGLHWLGWGQKSAAGLGTAFANDCTPDCAAGRFHSYRAVLILSGTQRCQGRVAYRTATVAVVGEPPQAWTTAADATYPLRCAT